MPSNQERPRRECLLATRYSLSPARGMWGIRYTVYSVQSVVYFYVYRATFIYIIFIKIIIYYNLFIKISSLTLTNSYYIYIIYSYI